LHGTAGRRNLPRRPDLSLELLERSRIGRFQPGCLFSGKRRRRPLVRLEGRAGSAPVTAVREREHLRRSFSQLSQIRITLGMEVGREMGTEIGREMGRAIGREVGLHPLLVGLAVSLREAGAVVHLVDGDWSAQAVASNDHGSDVFVGLVISDDPLIEARYFSVPGFESWGGRQLAELIIRELPATPGWTVGTVRGMRMPVLRETRAPAVVVKLGSSRPLDEDQGLITASLHRALDRWSQDPG